MRQLCYMGILKERFLAYSSPVMLISRKVTKDKRVITDFRHLNVRIAKHNLAYPLVRDTFSLLGSSKCEVLSVLDLKSFRFKRCIPFPEIIRNFKEILWNTPIFWQHILFISENAYETKNLSFYMAIIYKHDL